MSWKNILERHAAKF